MLVEEITYEDYNGNQITENFYFNMTKLELIELELTIEGGLQAKADKLTKTENGPEAYAVFKDILLDAYGVKSEDGKKFLKTPEIRADFESSPALGELIFSFFEDAAKAARFVEGCLPRKLVAEAQAAAAANSNQPQLPSDAEELVTTNVPAEKSSEEPKKFEDHSREELLSMADSQFADLIPKNPMEMTQNQLQIAMQRKNAKQA